MSGFDDTTALILAGVSGHAFGHSSGKKRKVLAEVRTAVHHYLLDQVLAERFSRHPVPGYRSEQVKSTLGDSYEVCPLRVFIELPLGTGGALRTAAMIDSDPVLVLNGDSYCGAPLSAWPRLASASQRHRSALGVPDTVLERSDRRKREVSIPERLNSMALDG
jgi:NDP-sugar pyrophosphorylase family protein